MESKAGELELQQQNTLLRSTLESMDQGLIMVDREGIVQLCNQRAIELLDLPADLMRSKPSFEAVRRYQLEQQEFSKSPDALRHWVETSGLERVNHVYERERPNGTVLEIRTVPIADGGAVRTYTDVTARRRADAVLAESEARYRTLAETLPQKVWITDREGRAIYQNRRLMDYHGPVGANVEDRVRLNHPDDAERMWAERQAGLAAGQPFSVEGRLRRHDGVYRWHQVSLTPIKSGDEITGWVGTSLDIHDLREADAKIRASEARYRLLSHHASDVIILQTKEGVRNYVSPSCRTILGYEPEELRTLPIDRFVHPGDLDDVLALFAKLGPERSHETSLHRVRHKDGRWLWVEAAFTWASYEGQSVILSAVRDVTERQRQAAELREAKEVAEAALLQANQASQAKSDFLATMSHEVRTPLNGIIGYTDLLLEDPTLGPHQKYQAGRIRAAGTALLTVVNDVLDFSKIEAGQIELERHPFALSSLIDAAISIVAATAEQKNIALEIELAPDLPTYVLGDQDRIRQVLLNLLNNAVKFTHAGEVRVDVESLSRTETEHTLGFAVTDTGIGIPVDQQDRLFQRFHQVDSTDRRRYGGTGLGLAISKNLVELMGGTMGVRSAPGQGSTFWFTVCLGVAEPATGAEDVSISEPLPEPQGPQANILLAEDNEINQEIARAVLERAGHHVQVVPDGAAAILAVQSGTFDLVLMDVQMPGIDGLTATRHIRALPHPICDVPIVAMTANVLPQQIEQVRAAGMNDHIGKPFRREELFSAIERWAKPLVAT
jgi:PAS domain S-box-containing protein